MYFIRVLLKYRTLNDLERNIITHSEHIYTDKIFYDTVKP